MGQSMGQSVNAAGSRFGFHSAYDLLDEFIGNGHEFEQISLLATPLNMLVDHHQVCLKHRPASCCAVNLGPSWNGFLVFEFGSFGLATDMEQVDPTLFGARRLESHQCTAHPDDVKRALSEIQQLQYHVLTWNCQHFARHMLDRLGNRPISVPQQAFDERSDLDLGITVDDRRRLKLRGVF
mmetsp:Transcript_46036/g.99394  ORF Transcript_46036/g.99394 Transcript_46036/m.99394 type:complete len:181 (+) Transcript_46036:344-886(+)